MQAPTSRGQVSGSGSAGSPACGVPAALERSLTEVARDILRLEAPPAAGGDAMSVDRAGYWLLVRIDDCSPVRLSDLADDVGLDLSTVSRHVSHLAGSGLVARTPDQHDRRAALLDLTARGHAVLEAVSVARRAALAAATLDWTAEERDVLAAGLSRLEAGLAMARDRRPRTRRVGADPSREAPGGGQSR